MIEFAAGFLAAAALAAWKPNTFRLIVTFIACYLKPSKPDDSDNAGA